MDTYGETEPVSFIVGWRNWIDAAPSRGFNRNYRFESCPDYNWDGDTQQIWHRFLNKDVADASNGFTEGVLGLIGRVPTHLLVMVDFLSGKTRRVFQYEKPRISTPN